MSVTGYSTQRIYGSLSLGESCLVNLHRFALAIGTLPTDYGIPAMYFAYANGDNSFSPSTSNTPIS